MGGDIEKYLPAHQKIINEEKDNGSEIIELKSKEGKDYFTGKPIIEYDIDDIEKIAKHIVNALDIKITVTLNLIFLDICLLIIYLILLKYLADHLLI